MIPEPKLNASEQTFPGERDTLLLVLYDKVTKETLMVKIPVPLGHSPDELDLEYSRGDGWKPVGILD